MFVSFFALVVIVAFTGPAVTGQVTINPGYYYKLTNQYTGPNRAVDVNGDGSGNLMIADNTDVWGQEWRFVLVGAGPKYALRTSVLGDAFSLDVRNDKGVDSTGLNISPTTGASGQYWTLSRWYDGTYRLSNDFTGTEKHLDVSADGTIPLLDTGDKTGQHWFITPIRQIPDPAGITPIYARPGQDIWNEGSNNYSVFVKPDGIVKAVMLFVYFDDMPRPPTDDPLELVKFLSGPRKLQDWFIDESRGQVAIQISAVVSQYGWRKVRSSLRKDQFVNPGDQKAFISAAINLLTPREVNFANYDLVMVVPCKTCGVSRPAAWARGPEEAIDSQSGPVRRGITFGTAAYDQNGYSATVHELGHSFGLPDLYPSPDPGRSTWSVGAWDVMSDRDIGGHFLGWHRYKLGWIPIKGRALVVWAG
jgi:M6 family metalloprotease-like protein